MVHSKPSKLREPRNAIPPTNKAAKYRVGLSVAVSYHNLHERMRIWACRSAFASHHLLHLAISSQGWRRAADEVECPLLGHQMS
jgi:hypothetical protein